MSTAERSKWRSALLDPAYAAALGLIAIQISIGVIYKMAAYGGKDKASYAFSPSASMTISEFIKFVLTAAYFYWTRQASSPNTSGYTLVGSNSSDRSSLDEKQGAGGSDVDVELGEKGEELIQPPQGAGEMMLASIAVQGIRISWKSREAVEAVRNEISQDTICAYIRLAMLYSFINNTQYVSYKLADPGTMQLLKSGVTIVTAVAMYTTLSTKLAKLQWLAILLQLCGLIITQYHPGYGSTYSLSTYLLLSLQTTISALAGVYNQQLNKRQDACLVTDNMIMYIAGIAINIAIHIITRILKPDEPGFFVGYHSLTGIMVILSNVFVGLAITAVYKYADAMIKCFATALSTAGLLYLTRILFGTQLSILVIPGTLMVFLSTWMYVRATPPKELLSEKMAGEPAAPAPSSFVKVLQIFSLKFMGPITSTLVWTVVTVVLISELWISSAHLKDLRTS